MASEQSSSTPEQWPGAKNYPDLAARLESSQKPLSVRQQIYLKHPTAFHDAYLLHQKTLKVKWANMNVGDYDGGKKEVDRSFGRSEKGKKAKEKKSNKENERSESSQDTSKGNITWERTVTQENWKKLNFIAEDGSLRYKRHQSFSE